MKQLIIKDKNGNNYVVDDPNQFRKHLFEFHTYKGKADLSLHEEKGHYFIVTTKLFDEVNKFIEKNKK